MLLGVHISDGVLELPWIIGGWLIAAMLIAYSARRVSEDEIPRIGVLTAAFFTASQIHIPLGFTTAHLLMNGLTGVILRRRAVVAIAVGLTLQTLLLGHGGMTTIGVNISIISIPALISGILISPIRRSGMLHSRVLRLLLTSLAGFFWWLGVIEGVEWTRSLFLRVTFPVDIMQMWCADPWVLVVVGLLSLGTAWATIRIERDPEFAVGLFLGGGTAAATVALNIAVLNLGGTPEIRSISKVVLPAYWPLILVEACITGFIVAFLAKAKPEWLK